MPARAWWDHSLSEWAAFALTLLFAIVIWSLTAALAAFLLTPALPYPNPDGGLLEIWPTAVATGALWGLPGLLAAASWLAPRWWRVGPLVGATVAFAHFLLGYTLLVAFARSPFVLLVGLVYMSVGWCWALPVRRFLKRR